MIKVVWCRFKKCLDQFTMLLVDRFSETELFRDLSNYVFGFRNFGNTKSMTVNFSFQNVEDVI